MLATGHSRFVGHSAVLDCIDMTAPPLGNASLDAEPDHLESSGFDSPGLEMAMPLFGGFHDRTERQFLLTPPVDTVDLLSAESRAAKRPAETQIPPETPATGSLDKRIANRKIDEHALLVAKYDVVVEESRKQEELIVSLKSDLQRLRDEKDRLKMLQNEERRTLVEEIQTLRYENVQLKAYTDDVLKRSSTETNMGKYKKLELDFLSLQAQLVKKDEENRRLSAKFDKLDEDYSRLAETTVMDPADNYPVRAVHTVECTFRPISPPTDQHECVNPGYSENCSVSNADISVTARLFASRSSEEPASKLDLALEREAVRIKQQVEQQTTTSFWTKAKTLSQKKPNKWVELPSLPGEMMDMCAATEHNGRLYVATTVLSPAQAHSPVPVPQIQLVCWNDKDRRWCNLKIPSPADAIHPTALLSHKNRLYLVTAQEGGDSIWMLDTQLKCWTFLSATVKGETACAACLVDGEIVMAGGAGKEGAGTSCSRVRSFCIDTMSWNLGWPQLSSPRHAARLVLRDRCLYISGGGVGSKSTGFDTMSSVECLTLSDIKAGWKELGRSKRLSASIVSTGKTLVFAGGLVREPAFAIVDNVALTTFDERGQHSMDIAPLNIKRSASCLVAFNNRLYCIGGCSNKMSFCNSVEELSLE